MNQKKYFFMVGLPRSGSTVLQAILNQNPEIYCTPTSPLLDQIVFNYETWNSLQTVKANKIQEQLDNITRGIIHAMWYHQPEEIIIDKNRGWGKNISAADYLFKEKIKSIVVLRDLPSVMASWLTLMKKNPGNSIDIQLQSKRININDETRTMEMWNYMVKDCVECVVQIQKDAPGRLHFVSYDELITHPRQTMQRIDEFLNIPSYSYQFNKIESNTTDDDAIAWGMDGMHTVRPSLSKTSKNPKDILGEKLFNYFTQQEMAHQIHKLATQS